MEWQNDMLVSRTRLDRSFVWPSAFVAEDCPAESLQANAGIVPRSGHDLFLPKSFPIHQSAFYVVLYANVLDADRVVK
jgi:hypothetical protein